MKTERRFLLAPSLARLVRREQGSSERIAEGYFPPRPGRTHLVRIEAAQCRLVLISTGSAGVDDENETELPRSQAEALMAVCAGTVAYERTPVQLESGGETFLNRLVAPGALDLLTVAFASSSAAQGFCAPAWFGREVSDEPAFERCSVALDGLPPAEEVPLSNAMLDAYLDAGENRSGADRPLIRADLATARPTTAPQIRPATPLAAGRSSAEPGQGDRLNGVAAGLSRTARGSGEGAHREHPPGPSERLGWRTRQPEQRT